MLRTNSSLEMVKGRPTAGATGRKTAEPFAGAAAEQVAASNRRPLHSMEVDHAGHEGGVENDARSTKTATPRPADLASSGDAILETFTRMNTCVKNRRMDAGSWGRA